MGGFRGREFERDWRDYFIMSVVGGGVGWLAVKLAQVSSHLRLSRVSWKRGEKEFEGSRVGGSVFFECTVKETGQSTQMTVGNP